MQTILITGGAGFIGFHLTKKLLKRGDKVISIDNFNDYYDPDLKRNRVKPFLSDTNFKLYKVDICDFEKMAHIFKTNKIDKVCHLAAQAGVRYSIENPFTFEETNVRGTLNLLELAKNFKVKNFVYASSSSVYGGVRKMPWQENQKLETPVSLYAATKKSNELMAHTYHHLFNIPCTGLRYFTVYGPWGRPDMALFKFAQKMSEGKPIDVYNFGKMKRDFTYIDDIIEGTLAALDKNFAYEIFNLGNSLQVELEYFIGCIEKELGIKAKKNYLPLQAGDVLESWADISKAQKMLGYSPRTGIEEGIKKTIRWFKEYYKIF